MARKSRKLPAIVFEDLTEVMEEVTKELGPLLNRKMSTKEHEAANIFVGTLSVMILNIFDYLPPEQRDEILANCGTWFDIGMLLGRSPELLVKILNKVNPKVENVEIPDWLTEMLARRLTSEGEG